MSRTLGGNVRGLDKLTRKLSALASLDRGKVLRQAEKAALEVLADEADAVLRMDGHAETEDLRQETADMIGNWEVTEHRKSSRLSNGSPQAKHHEFGTGVHNPYGGRSEEWEYKGADGRFHRTEGITPVAPLRRAADANEGKIAGAAAKELKAAIKRIVR